MTLKERFLEGVGGSAMFPSREYNVFVFTDLKIWKKGKILHTKTK